MNFFKTVFSDEPDSPQAETTNAPDNTPDPHSSPPDPRSEPDSSAEDSGVGAWRNFGGLIKTLTSKSESIIETYRRDLEEFSTGLKKEIEVAHTSLETVGQAFDQFGNTVVKGTAQIISQGKDAILAADLDSDSDNRSLTDSGEGNLNSKRYSRFESKVRVIQGDISTYVEGPEDLDDYNKWKSEFSLEGKIEEMERFIGENDAMGSVYRSVVPSTVDHETFWYRYYYKVYRMKKAEDVRARLVRRMSNEDEDLSWDVDDDDDEEKEEEEEEEEYEGEGKPKAVINKDVGGGERMGQRVDTQLQVGSSGASNEEGTKRSNVEEVQCSDEEESEVVKGENLLQSKELDKQTDKSVEESQVEKFNVVHEVGDVSKEAVEETGVDKASKLEVDNAVNKNDSAAESDEKGVTERKADDGKSSDKNNESSLVGSQHTEHDIEDEEEDLGWDEIEDLSSIDDKKATESGSTSKVDLRKRLTVAEEEEDLSWDIEDDDEPAKA